MYTGENMCSGGGLRLTPGAVLKEPFIFFFFEAMTLIPKAHPLVGCLASGTQTSSYLHFHNTGVLSTCHYAGISAQVMGI